MPLFSTSFIAFSSESIEFVQLELGVMISPFSFRIIIELSSNSINEFNGGFMENKCVGI